MTPSNSIAVKFVRRPARVVSFALRSIWGQGELEALLGEHKLAIRAVFDSIPYDVDAVLGEPSWTSTYLCQKT